MKKPSLRWTFFDRLRAAPVGAALFFYALLLGGVRKLRHQLLQNGHASIHVLCGNML